MKPNDAEVWEHAVHNAVLLVFPWYCMSVVIERGMHPVWKTHMYKREGLVFNGMPTDGRHKDNPSGGEMWRRIA